MVKDASGAVGLKKVNNCSDPVVANALAYVSSNAFKPGEVKDSKFQVLKVGDRVTDVKGEHGVVTELGMWCGSPTVRYKTATGEPARGGMWVTKGDQFVKRPGRGYPPSAGNSVAANAASGAFKKGDIVSWGSEDTWYEVKSTQDRNGSPWMELETYYGDVWAGIKKERFWIQNEEGGYTRKVQGPVVPPKFKLGERVRDLTYPFKPTGKIAMMIHDQYGRGYEYGLVIDDKYTGQVGSKHVYSRTNKSLQAAN